MAMQATHARFAQTVLSPLFENSVPGDAFMGATYPDSRYVTRVSRTFTHATAPEHPLAPDLSPFERGWASHILYDELAHPAYRSFLDDPTVEIKAMSEDWLRVTAVKMVEDQISFAALGNKPLFADGALPPAREGESEEQLKKYYAAVKDFYQQPRELEHYLGMLTRFSIPQDFAEQIIAFAQKLKQDPISFQRIQDIFDDCVKRA